MPSEGWAAAAVYKADTADKTRARIITKGTDATLLLWLSSGDLATVQLMLKPANGMYRDMTVGSVYMPYNVEDLAPQQEAKKLVAYANNKGLELLQGCNANSHQEVWGSTNINHRAESLSGFIMCSKLHILNTGKEPTFLDSRKQKVLDVTLCTDGLTSLVRDWRVSCESSGSDRGQICFALNQIQREKEWGHIFPDLKTGWAIGLT